MEKKDLDEIRRIIGDEEKTLAVIAVIEKVENKKKAHNHKRQAEGIAAAKERGVQFGRPKMTFPKNFEGIYNCYKNKAITGTHAAEVLGINRNSFRELVRRHEAALEDGGKRKNK